MSDIGIKAFAMMSACLVMIIFMEACTPSGEKSLDTNEEGQFTEENRELMWRVVLLSPSGETIKEWTVKTEPEWVGGDDGHRCSFHEPETGKIMVSKYTFIEPMYISPEIIEDTTRQMIQSDSGVFKIISTNSNK